MRSILFVVAVLAGAALPASAQERLERGDVIRFRVAHASATDQVVGRYRAVIADSLRFTTNRSRNTVLAVSLAQVTQLEVRRGNTRGGAFAGATLGALVGTLALGGIVAASSADLISVVLIAPVGAVIGGVLGAVVGARRASEWRPADARAVGADDDTMTSTRGH